MTNSNNKSRKKTKQSIKQPPYKKTRKKQHDVVLHQILGNENNLQQINQQFSRLKNQLSITFNTTKKLKPKINAITVPHAGFVYSGILGLFTINEILEANKTAKTITILWFRHNKETQQEHSMINVEKLIKLLNSTIKIKTIEITKLTRLTDLKEQLKPPFLVSTDFAHYNYGTPARNLIEAWENDKLFLTMKNKNTLSLVASNKKYPCGSQPLRIMKEWSSKKGNVLHLFGYSNSKYKEKWWLKDNKQFDGVTYASVGSIKKSHNWFSPLNSKMLAYSHLGWIKDCLHSNNNNTFADNNGLFWSPLKSMKGSCFLTVYRENKDTYSCFGSWEKQSSSKQDDSYWEKQSSSLLHNIIDATKTVKRVSWGSNKPVNKHVLNTHLKGKYSLSLSLIEPQNKWKLVLDANNPSIKRNRGYVYCHIKTKKIGMTFLPSVWDSISNKKEFFEKLKQKHEGNYPKNPNHPNEWGLYCYESISWNLQL